MQAGSAFWYLPPSPDPKGCGLFKPHFVGWNHWRKLQKASVSTQSRFSPKQKGRNQCCRNWSGFVERMEVSSTHSHSVRDACDSGVSTRIVTLPIYQTLLRNLLPSFTTPALPTLLTIPAFSALPYATSPLVAPKAFSSQRVFSTHLWLVIRQP